MGGDTVGHIVAQGVEVHCALAQDLLVARLHLQLDAVLGKVAAHIGGVFAADLHVGAEPVGDLHLLLIGQDVGGVAGQGIAGDEADHVAHLELGVVLVGVSHRLGAGHELVVQRLETHLIADPDIHTVALVALAGAQLQDGAQVHGAAVDLVEGQPVFHLVLVPLEDGLAVVHVQVHQVLQ